MMVCDGLDGAGEGDGGAIPHGSKYSPLQCCVGSQTLLERDGPAFFLIYAAGHVLEGRVMIRSTPRTMPRDGQCLAATAISCLLVDADHHQGSSSQ